MLGRMQRAEESVVIYSVGAAADVTQAAQQMVSNKQEDQTGRRRLGHERSL